MVLELYVIFGQVEDGCAFVFWVLLVSLLLTYDAGRICFVDPGSCFRVCLHCPWFVHMCLACNDGELYIACLHFVVLKPFEFEWMANITRSFAWMTESG